MHYVFTGSITEHRTVVQGQKVTLSCYSNTSMEWRFDNHLIYSLGNVNARYAMHIKQGHYDLSFSISSLNDSGVYKCFEEDGELPLRIFNLTVIHGNCFYFAIISTK